MLHVLYGCIIWCFTPIKEQNGEYERIQWQGKYFDTEEVILGRTKLH